MKYPPVGFESVGRAGSIYSAVANALIADIQSGRYAIGARLPSEGELEQRFGVSRHTVRQALRELKERGLISTQQGVGTTVAARHTALRFVHSGTTLDDLLQFAQVTRTEIVEWSEIVADEATAQRMRCPAGQAWLRLLALRYAADDADPMAHLWVYLRPEFAGIIPQLESSSRPHFTLIEQVYGIKLAEMEQEISSVSIDDDIADRLRIARGGHGLQIVRRFRDEQDRLTQVSVGTYPADRLVHTTKVRVKRGGE
jgi:DNA-binding GntR family transcriptional regulator